MHLYVLRDGLAPETKSKKLYEVERYEGRTRWFRLLSAALLPGAPQMLRGRTWIGILLLTLWFAALIGMAPELVSFGQSGGLSLAGDLLYPGQVPTRFDQDPLRFAAMLALPVIWLVGNFRLWWAKEV